MRIISQHGVAGYVTPQERPSCRDCKFLSNGEENGIGQVSYRSCRLHSFEVRAGGICDSHQPDRWAHAATRSPSRGVVSLMLDLGATQ